MAEIVTVSIGIGLAISLLFSEILGVAAGGMVVPGYVAIHLHKPLVVIYTLIASYITYFTAKVLSSVIIIYGRRRTVLMILVGFLFGWIIRYLGFIPKYREIFDITIIGYIIPGLIAIWMDRQGVIETVSTLITSSIIVRFVLIIIYGKDIIK